MGMGGIKTTDKLTVFRFSVTFVSRGMMAAGCYSPVDQAKAVNASNRTAI